MMRVHIMKFARGGLICIASLFRRVKISDEVLTGIRFNRCGPFGSSLVKPDSFVAAGVVALRTSIAEILRRRSRAKIAPAVIGRIAVDMIYFASRPPARHPNPYQSVCEVERVKNADANVPPFTTVTRDITNLDASGQPNLPTQEPRIRIVFKQSFYFRGAQIVMCFFMSAFHAVSLASESGPVKDFA